MWPRDHYVYFQGRYIASGSPGSIDGNPFGEGGNVLTGSDFLLVSDSIYVNDHIARHLPEHPTYEQIKKAILKEGEVHHPSAKIHVVPSGYFHGGKGHDHIDMFCLLLPRRKLLLLDTYYGKKAGKTREYDVIAEAEGLTLIRYDGSQDKVWYPLNALVLPTENSDVVVVDDRALSLIKLLQDNEVDTIEVEMPQHSFPGGKINCQTNIFNSKDNLDLENLLASS